MKASQRRKEIVRLARSQGLASVADLSRTFAVTPSTIRRDLARLRGTEELARTYGGVMAVPALTREAGLAERSEDAQSAKESIARCAAERVGVGQTVLLGAGTTTAQLAAALRGKAQLTVVTNGLTQFFELAGVRRILLGGEYRGGSQSFAGDLAESAIQNWDFDAAFLGADSVNVERGIGTGSVKHARLKLLMAKAARRVHLLAHAAKLDGPQCRAWIRLPAGWTLITDATATPTQLEPFRQSGVEVVQASSFPVAAEPLDWPLKSVGAAAAPLN